MSWFPILKMSTLKSQRIKPRMNNCLNCGEPIENKFCSHCGQPTTTHRFSFKHFFSHDIMHGAFHLDKGFPLTIKELFTKPRTGVREYIEGKRTGYFNYITLILILIGFAHFLESYTLISLQDVVQFSVEQDPDPKAAKTFKEVFDLLFGTIREYPKLFTISFIPIYALISLLIFKKAKLNYAEHLVIGFYKASAVVLISYLDVISRSLTTNIT